MAGYVIRSTVIVPKTVAVLEQGQTVATGVAVDLPEPYGNNLVDLRLAVRDDAALDAQAAARAAEAEAEARAARADRIAAIIEALEDDAYGKDGKPHVDAINAALGDGDEAVTAAERDAVWAAMEEE
ncbi:hypothetical protein ATO8_21241 [Roseivivax marinus]|uniref:Uncharacterized protein n=1 Tax=Roseivivax marinus TaxID=1379903 RepID=W4HF61_9RHOB|nr:hypothetical protein [Roseivivax marinus]ETW10630.1 hypothetical protein ATO8_21241 [Roseivivax marinus]